MKINLTETAITKAVRDAKPLDSGDKTAGKHPGKRIELADAVCPGLRLRVTPSGRRTWVLGCRDRAGAARRFVLGEHPALSIAEARAAARALRTSVTQAGADPVAERKRERKVAKDARAGIGTLEALLERYRREDGAGLKRWAECEKRIKSVFADHLQKPLARLHLTDLQASASGWPAKGSAAAAVRYLRPILKWAGSPTRKLVAPDLGLLAPPARVTKRTRVLGRAELAVILPALRTSGSAYAAAMRWILLTLCRREEACEALWSSVDWQAGTWTIPANDSKNEQPHTVVLSRQAKELLQSRLPRDDNGEALRPDPVARIFGGAAGNLLTNWDRFNKSLMRTTGTAGWHRHDLRRTSATLLAELGTPPHLIKSALNHVDIVNTLESTYNRHRYGAEAGAALQKLADCLDAIGAIEAGQTGTAAPIGEAAD